MSIKEFDSQVKYSIIVPVYNVELVLPRCIESVLNQTVSDFELILVDDGSPDGSGSICDAYSERDSRVHVIHQKNAGVSAARNAGIKAAQGEFIVFVDSDDFVEPDLLRYLSESDADFVMVSFGDYADNKVIRILLDDSEKWLLHSAEGIRKYLNKCSTVFIWAKRYRKSIIDRNGISFREDMKINEDIIFNNDYLLCANTAESIDWIGYYHCQYEMPTLSTSANAVSFVERNLWREISYSQFRGCRDIQNVYVSQTLYFAEQEFLRIVKNKSSFSEKCSKIKNIISDEFFRKCLAEMPEAFPPDVRVFCNLKLAALIAWKYGR